MDRGGASLQLHALCRARRERGVIAIRRGRPRPAAARIPPGSAGEQDLEGLALPAGRGYRRGAVLRLPDRRSPRRRAGPVACLRSGEGPARPLGEGGLLPAGVRSRGRQAPGPEPGEGAAGCPAATGAELRPGSRPDAATSAGHRDHLRDARPRLHAESQQRRPARAQGHLRRCDRQDSLPGGAGDHHGRAAPRAAVRPAGGQLLGLHDPELLRPARRLCVGRPGRPRRVPGDGPAPCTRRTSRSSSTSSTTTRPRPARTGRPTAFAGSTTSPST